jgi:hypothetical protein
MRLSWKLGLAVPWCHSPITLWRSPIHADVEPEKMERPQIPGKTGHSSKAIALLDNLFERPKGNSDLADMKTSTYSAAAIASTVDDHVRINATP